MGLAGSEGVISTRNCVQTIYSPTLTEMVFGASPQWQRSLLWAVGSPPLLFSADVYLYPASERLSSTSSPCMCPF